MTQLPGQTSLPATKTIKVNAPFAMPGITVPDFSQATGFDIRDYGAVAQDKSANDSALRSAIAAANRAGAGTVIIPPGEWLCGPIHLRSNVNLHLTAGATLLFSENPSDYLPAVKTSWEGMECYNYSPLIYAYECSNVAISGKGTLRFHP